jgi:Holliday junction resolvase-like predicted endonuclease
MTIELNLLISILKMTKEGSALTESVNKDARIATGIASKLLKKMQTTEIIYIKNGIIEADSCARLKIAVSALTLGADLQRVSELLSWQEFEDVATIALEQNGYNVSKNTRFKHAGRRWEMDVIGCKKPWVICIDCKRWQHGMSPSALRKVTEAQIERTQSFAESLPNIKFEIECAKWHRAQFVPAILALTPGTFKFYDMVPIIPILQLQDFIGQFPAYTGSLKHFWKEFSHLNNDS